MAQTYTLEEAAQRLGLSQDEFKRRIKDEWKAVRSFRDGPTLRYRATDIDELARQLGEASDPGFQLGPVGAESVEVPESFDDSDHFALNDDTPEAKKPAADEPLLFDTDEEPTFHFEVDPGEKAAKTGADSNVRVDAPAGSGRQPDPNQSQLTDEISLDLSGPSSSIIRPGQLSGTKLTSGLSGNKLAGPMSSTKLSGPPSGKIPGPTSGIVNPDDGSSEFELNLDADSDSFELKLGNDSDEADIGLDLSPPAGSDRGPLSGINLGKPADSGLSLESRPSSIGPSTLKGSDVDQDFELTLDGPTDTDTAKQNSSRSLGAKKNSLDSEFELTLDDNSGVVDSLGEDLLGPKSTPKSGAGQGDIFETDFELPVMSDESGSEVVAVDSDEFSTDIESSDFDLAISDSDAPADDDSASQVVLVDDELPEYDDGGVVVEEDDAFDEVALEEGASASKALRGVRPDDDDDEEYDYTQPAQTVAAAPAPWGALPVVVLFPCLFLTFLGAIMSFELLRGMWGYQQPTTPGNLVVRGMADAFGLKTAD